MILKLSLHPQLIFMSFQLIYFFTLQYPFIMPILLQYVIFFQIISFIIKLLHHLIILISDAIKLEIFFLFQAIFFEVFSYANFKSVHSFFYPSLHCFLHIELD